MKILFSRFVIFYIPLISNYHFGVGTANVFNLDVTKLNPVDNDPKLHNFNNKFS
jgi:hypothetical protein